MGIMKLIYVKAENGDWEGIYIDGELFYEGQSIPTDVMIDIIMLNKHFAVYNSVWVESEWLEERGSLPLYFEDIPEEVLT